MPRIRLKWTQIAVFMAIGAAAYLAIYFQSPHSESFQFAEQWIRESGQFEADVGEIASIRLLPSSGFQESLDGEDHSARLVIEIVGTKGSTRVLFQMAREAGQWKVIRARKVE